MYTSTVIYIWSVYVRIYVWVAYIRIYMCCIYTDHIRGCIWSVYIRNIFIYIQNVEYMYRFGMPHVCIHTEQFHICSECPIYVYVRNAPHICIHTNHIHICSECPHICIIMDCPHICIHTDHTSIWNMKGCHTSIWNMLFTILHTNLWFWIKIGSSINKHTRHLYQNVDIKIGVYDIGEKWLSTIPGLARGKSGIDDIGVESDQILNQANLNIKSRVEKWNSDEWNHGENILPLQNCR
jgi:hypothetical protein